MFTSTGFDWCGDGSILRASPLTSQLHTGEGQAGAGARTHSDSVTRYAFSHHFGA